MSDDSSSLESASVAAILAKRCLDERAEMLDELVTMLSEIVPGVQVDRALIGRRVKGVRVPLGEVVFVVKRGANDSYETNRAHQVRGVVIRTDPMELDEFLAELGRALEAELKRTERGRDALREWMNSTSS